MDTKSFIDKDKLSKSADIDPELTFKPMTGQILHDLDSLNSNEGILNALQALEIAYNEMKEHLTAQNELVDSGLPPSTLVANVKDTISQIQEVVQISRATPRKRKRRKSTRTETHEDKSEDEPGKSIRDKRVSIKAKALKVEKRKRKDSAGSDDLRKKKNVTFAKKVDYLRDPKHFRKITTVQQIFLQK